MIMQEEIEITNQDGSVQKFTIRKLPPLVGRKIVLGYPMTLLAAGKAYAANEELMKELISYVSVKTGDHDTFLKTDDLIANHVKDWYALGCLELKMIQFNCSFLKNMTEFGSVQDMFMQKFASYVASAVLASASEIPEKE